ncbi:MAG: putative rane protein [Eubacteriales bacterium]|nr:putative rane protein [Eubacteriales bacterium]
MNFLRIARVELKQLLSTRFARIALTAVVLVPLLYSFVYLSAFWDPYGKLSRLPVAVVNEDQGYKRGGEKIEGGRDLVEELKKSDAVEWHFVTMDEARRGLEGRKYYLIVRIPSDFSARLYQMRSKDPRQVGIEVTYNEGKNYLAAQLTKRVVEGLAQKVEEKIVAEAIGRVLAEMANSVERVAQAAEGSKQLAQGAASAREGAGKLHEGAGKLRAGAGELSTGLTRLADGSNSLAAGLEAYEKNVEIFAAKMTELQAGGKTIATGITALPAGQLAPGISRLQGGIKEAATGAASLKAGTGELAAGTEELACGVEAYTDGTAELIAGIKQFWGKIKSGLDQLLTSYRQVEAGLTAFLSSLQQAATSYQRTNQAIIGTRESLDQARLFLQQYRQTHPDPEVDRVLALLEDSCNTLDGTADDRKALDSFFGSGSAELALWQQTLAGTNGGFAGALVAAQTTYDQQLLPGMNLLQGEAETLKEGALAVRDGSRQLENGAGALSQGLQTIVSSTAGLPEKMAVLDEGFGRLQRGYGDFYAGLSQLVEGSRKLGGAAQQLATGGKQLAEGTAKATSGAAELAGGTEKIAGALSELHAGLGQLVKGASQLEEGLAQGVAKGKEELSPALIQKRREITAKPVQLIEKRLHPVENYGTAFTPYFLPLSLWIGALVLFFLINLKDFRLALSPVHSWQVLVGKYLAVAVVGVLQAVISGIILEKGLNLQVVSEGKFFLFNILMSLTFMAIIGFLVTAFGVAGRFLAVALLILQLASCGGAFPFELLPEFFRTIGPFLPMTYGVYGLREAVSGGSGMSYGAAVTAMAFFGLGALILTYFFTARKLKISDLAPQEGLVLQ